MYDYELNEEIFIKALHPKRMLRLMELYGEDKINKKMILTITII